MCPTVREQVPGFLTSRGVSNSSKSPRRSQGPSDEVLLDVIGRVLVENLDVYGISTMWHAMQKEGWDVGRDHVCA